MSPISKTAKVSPHVFKLEPITWKSIASIAMSQNRWTGSTLKFSSNLGVCKISSDGAGFKLETPVTTRLVTAKTEPELHKMLKAFFAANAPKEPEPKAPKAEPVAAKAAKPETKVEAPAIIVSELVPA